jgi:hypothetical protein
MVYLHIFRPYNHSSTATALSGITTRYSYKALRQMSVANIAVSWCCTWIGFTRLKNLLGSFLAPVNPINGYLNYLRRSLAHYPKYCRETDNVTLVWGKLILSNTDLCYDWLLICKKRHLTLNIRKFQSYKNAETILALQSTQQCRQEKPYHLPRQWRREGLERVR